MPALDARSARRFELVCLAVIYPSWRSSTAHRPPGSWINAVLADAFPRLGVTWDGTLNKVRAAPGDYTEGSSERWRRSGLPMWPPEQPDWHPPHTAPQQLDPIERPFYCRAMTLIGRWWNGQLSRNTRRDIWLQRDHVWRVKAREGDGHANVWTQDYPTEEDARAAIAAMIERTGGSDEWQEFATDPDPTRSNGPATGQ
jgi:hypothetical protein